MALSPTLLSKVTLSGARWAPYDYRPCPYMLFVIGSRAPRDKTSLAPHILDMVDSGNILISGLLAIVLVPPYLILLILHLDTIVIILHSTLYGGTSVPVNYVNIARHTRIVTHFARIA